MELTGVLQTAKNTSPGKDLITYEMLRHLHTTAKIFLLTIYNKIYSSGQYPDKWRTAIVLSFPKPGKPPDDMSSYRPIALTSCVGKTLEKIISARIMRHLEARSLLSPLQYGYRKMLSTQDALIRVQRDLQEALTRREHSVCVFFDLKKAYDTTWRFGILKEMHRMGFRGHLAHFVRNFLADRKFYTRIGNKLSTQHTQEEGVPQGSVLSCILFAIAINGITSVVPPNIKSSLYVDDYTIYCSSNNIMHLQRQLQSAINQVTAWANARGYSISTEKTVALHVHRTRSNAEPDLRLYGNMIPFNDNVRFLGMYFDEKLKWDVHIKQLKTKCTEKLSILRVLSHLSWGADRTSLLRLYRALIRSKLEYGAIIYGCASDKVLESLEPVHNAALRICTGAFRSSPIASLLSECGEPSLRQRRQQLTLQYYGHILSRPTSPTCQTMLRIPTGRAPPCTYAYQVNSLLNSLPMPCFRIKPNPRQEIPVWRFPVTLVCDKFTDMKKANTASNVMRALHCAHVAQYHEGDLSVYTDGSKDNANVGCAAVFPDITVSRKLLPETSIYTAELTAIYDALNRINLLQHSNITIFSDSYSALQSLKKYNTSHPLILEIQLWLTRLFSRHKNIRFCWLPGHMDIPGNCKADTEARAIGRAMGVVAAYALPHHDYYPIIRQQLHTRWEQEWRNIRLTNKLRAINDSFKAWHSSVQINRRTEVILCRLRIGHCLLTHQYLMETRHPPYCPDCVVPLTVRHILAECPTSQNERYRQFPQVRNMNVDETMKAILSETMQINYNVAPLVNYLSNLQILAKI